MNIFRHLDEIPGDWGPSVVSIGNFDGVHRAHQTLLRQVVVRARNLKARSLAVIFNPHPIRILRPDVPLRLLTPLPAKLRLLETIGIDGVALLSFNRDLSLMPARDFAAEILHRSLRALEVHEGYNFHFGHKAEGNVQRLMELGREFGFEVQEYPEMKIRGVRVSSSRIRDLLDRGDVSRARHLLGRVFGITALAGRGRGYGHKYTVPTVNLSRYDEMVPRDGVYVTYTRVGKECFEAVTNVGNRPTFGAESFAIESHLLNFHPIELSADTEVEVQFLHRVREEIKFPTVDALRAQIANDVRRARRLFHALGKKPG